MQYEVVSLDVWGNARNGFEVNGAYYTGNYVDVDIDMNRRDFFTALKKQEIISSYAGMQIDTDISNEDHIYIIAKSNGKPLFDLEKRMP